MFRLVDIQPTPNSASMHAGGGGDVTVALVEEVHAVDMVARGGGARKTSINDDDAGIPPLLMYSSQYTICFTKPPLLAP